MIHINHNINTLIGLIFAEIQFLDLSVLAIFLKKCAFAKISNKEENNQKKGIFKIIFLVNENKPSEYFSKWVIYKNSRKINPVHFSNFRVLKINPMKF